MKKIFKSILLSVLALCSVMVFTACGSKGDGDTGGTEPLKLDTPTNIRVYNEGLEIWWDSYQTWATNFTVTINGTEFTQPNSAEFQGICKPSVWDLYDVLPVARYVITVRANGDGVNYLTSNTAKLIHTVYSPITTTLSADGAEITDCTQDAGDVYLPSQSGISIIKSIGDYAFDGLSGITSVELPQYIKNIGKGAFRGCSSMGSIVIQNEVTFIADDAFEGCETLSKIFYCGAPDSWEELTKENKEVLYNATVYCYSESQPSNEQLDEHEYYWHWVDGAPVVW